MPLEGHYARQTTPLRALTRREKRLAAWLGGAIAVASVVVALVIVLASGNAHPRRGCIDATVASTTGGARARACGDAAIQTCRSAVASRTAADAGVREACRRAGILH
jgi:hypothetical protein